MTSTKKKTTAPRTAQDTRERIVDAAARIIDTRGLAHATTKAISREAGFSEATLYKHFEDKEALFLTVLRERMPQFIAMLQSLPERVGQGTVKATLEELAREALLFYDRSVPIGAALFAEPVLMARHREALRERRAGPQRGLEILAAYLRAEQQAGRLAKGLKPDAAAALLLGACFQRAFLGHFGGPRDLDDAPRVARDLVRTLLGGIGPPAT